MYHCFCSISFWCYCFVSCCAGAHLTLAFCNQQFSFRLCAAAVIVVFIFSHFSLLIVSSLIIAIASHTAQSPSGKITSSRETNGEMNTNSVVQKYSIDTMCAHTFKHLYTRFHRHLLRAKKQYDEQKVTTQLLLSLPKPPPTLSIQAPKWFKWSISIARMANIVWYITPCLRTPAVTPPIPTEYL